MKLVKTTKHHFIYQLTEREKAKVLEIYGYEAYEEFLLFLKEFYSDYKPNFNDDLGYEDFQAGTLETAIQLGQSN